MIKHKREVFLSESSHRGLVISGVFWGCTAIDLLIVYFKKTEARGLLIIVLIFAALSSFLLYRGLLKAINRRKKAMKSRYNFMKNGILSHGKVAAVGGGYYQKGHYRDAGSHRGKSKHFRIWESRWWADIEYYDVKKGVYRKHRITDLNKKSTKRLIGSDVDIYHLDEAVYIAFK